MAGRSPRSHRRDVAGVLAAPQRTPLAGIAVDGPEVERNRNVVGVRVLGVQPALRSFSSVVGRMAGHGLVVLLEGAVRLLVNS